MHLGRRRFAPRSPALAALALTGAWAAGAATAAPATVSASAGLTLRASAPAAKGLKAAGVRVTALAPATATSTRWTLPTAGATRADATSVPLEGGLRLRAGRRSVLISRLRASLGTRPALVALVGGRRVVLLSVAPARRAPLRRDLVRGSIRLTGASLTLTAAGATAIRTALRLRRLTGGVLGRLTLAVSARPTVTAAPAPPTATIPAPRPAAPAPATPAPATPAPTAPAPDPCLSTSTPLADTRPVPAGEGTTGWSAADLPGGTQFGFGNLRSWINYVTSCWSPAGSVEAIDGAHRADRYRYGYTVTGSTVAGSVRTVEHQGTIAYRLGGHGIETWITDPTITFDSATHTGRLHADGRYSADPSNPFAAPQAFTGLVLLELTDPSGTGTTSGALTLSARLTAAGNDVHGGTAHYPVGAAWGTFTVPAAP